VNRLAAIARKHDCPEVCKHIIATQYGFNAMEVQEAFVKIREQAQAYLEQPDQLIAGLNLLSGQNLDYFQTPHQVACAYSLQIHLFPCAECDTM
jgi:transformation/transcription domain-associated protein